MAVVIFNEGRTGLIRFIEQLGVPINQALVDDLIDKDSKRVEKAETTVSQRQSLIDKKNESRRHEMRAKDDVTEYGPGQH